MSGANLPSAKQRPTDRHAVDAIIDIVMSNPGEISVIAQAPLTNIAVAFLKEPRIAAAVRHLWIMGGTDSAVGNITPTAEFNFYVDPEAAKIVFGVGFPISLATWTLTLESGVFTAEMIDEIAALNTPLSDFFMKVSRIPRETALERYGETISTYPDSLTCACAIDETLILEAADCVVDIETTGELTRGISSIHPAKLGTRWPERQTNCRVLRKADVRRFHGMLIRALS
jgi:purine nucleosidase